MSDLNVNKTQLCFVGKSGIIKTWVVLCRNTKSECEHECALSFTSLYEKRESLEQYVPIWGPGLTFMQVWETLLQLHMFIFFLQSFFLFVFSWKKILASQLHKIILHFFFLLIADAKPIDMCRLHLATTKYQKRKVYYTGRTQNPAWGPENFQSNRKNFTSNSALLVLVELAFDKAQH